MRSKAANPPPRSIVAPSCMKVGPRLGTIFYFNAYVHSAWPWVWWLFGLGVVKSMQKRPQIAPKSKKMVQDPFKNDLKWFKNREKSVKIIF